MGVLQGLRVLLETDMDNQTVGSSHRDAYKHWRKLTTYINHRLGAVGEMGALV